MSLNQRSSANPANRNAVLDRRISSGEDLTRDLPSRWAGGSSTSLYVLTIVGGNTLVTTQAGIAYSSSAITDVPAAYDPDVTSSFIDGIGRATLYINGVAQTSKVLVCNDSTGGTISFALLTGDVIVTATTKTLTVGGDPDTTVTAYVPHFM